MKSTINGVIEVFTRGLYKSVCQVNKQKPGDVVYECPMYHRQSMKRDEDTVIGYQSFMNCGLELVKISPMFEGSNTYILH